MDNYTERYLEIINEFQELEDMLEGMFGEWSMARVKSKLSKIEYDICGLYMSENMKEVAVRTSERIEALEEEVKAANKRVKIAIRYSEKIRELNRNLCNRLEADGLLDKYLGTIEGEK